MTSRFYLKTVCVNWTSKNSSAQLTLLLRILKLGILPFLKNWIDVVLRLITVWVVCMNLLARPHAGRLAGHRPKLAAGRHQSEPPLSHFHFISVLTSHEKQKQKNVFKNWGRLKKTSSGTRAVDTSYDVGG